MAFVPALEYHPLQHRLKLPWPWSLDIDKTYGHAAHHYCPSKHYASLHLQPRTTHWPLHAHRPGSAYGDVEVDNRKFVVHVDVAQFSPDELNVHFTHKNELVVEGRHAEKADEHGSIERHFKRRYQVPSDVDEDEMKCELSSDGILTVYVPFVKPDLGEGVKKNIPIQLVDGPAAVKAPAPEIK